MTSSTKLLRRCLFSSAICRFPLGRKGQENSLQLAPEPIRVSAERGEPKTPLSRLKNKRKLPQIPTTDLNTKLQQPPLLLLPAFPVSASVLSTTKRSPARLCAHPHCPVHPPPNPLPASGLYRRWSRMNERTNNVVCLHSHRFDLPSSYYPRIDETETSHFVHVSSFSVVVSLSFVRMNNIVCLRSYRFVLSIALLSLSRCNQDQCFLFSNFVMLLEWALCISIFSQIWRYSNYMKVKKY
jgi:hypothetical protein